MNDHDVETQLSPGMVTLDFIRSDRKLTGTKEGCREGECGACTVLMGERKEDKVQYKAAASCLLPLGELDRKHIVTIEGLNHPDKTLNPIQQALLDEGGSQCGFCTPGIVVSLTGFFLSSQSLDYYDGINALDGNLCRCTGYGSIRRAIQKLCDTFAAKLDNNLDRIEQLVRWEILPVYFLQIPQRLKALEEHDASHPPLISHSPHTIVAGGTDLYVQKPGELQEKELLFISHRSDLSGIKQKNNWLYVGAGTTVEEFKNSPLVGDMLPNLKQYLYLVSSTIMRNRATLAGNIVNASPIGDLAIILLALDSDLCLLKENKRRQFPLKDFFKGYKKFDLKKGEIIETIEIPIPHKVWDFRFHFEKVSQRKYLDIASCNSAISLRLDDRVIADINISAGGAAPVPLYLKETCSWLRGKKVNTENILEAVKIMTLEISPISDVRGSAQYKTLLLQNLVFSHFITLFPEINLGLPGQRS